jgi:hypothetical protein
MIWAFGIILRAKALEVLHGALSDLKGGVNQCLRFQYYVLRLTSYVLHLTSYPLSLIPVLI